MHKHGSGSLSTGYSYDEIALRDYMERRGGSLRLEALFPDQPTVFLAGLDGDGGGKKAKKKTAAGAKSKPKSGRAT
jgi:hypothetical protein